MNDMDKFQMRVTMSVTLPQALALQSMFDYWSKLGRVGSSRDVSFFVDGDGNFRPECTFVFSEDVPHLTAKLRELAVKSENEGHRQYDFDSIAWSLKEEGQDEMQSGEFIQYPPQWWRVLWHRIKLFLSSDKR